MINEDDSDRFGDDDVNDVDAEEEFSREQPTKPGSEAGIARVESSAFAHIARAIDGVASALEQIPWACERIPSTRRGAFYQSVATRLSEGAELFHEMRRWVQDAARLEAEEHKAKTKNGNGHTNGKNGKHK